MNTVRSTLERANDVDGSRPTRRAWRDRSWETAANGLAPKLVTGILMYGWLATAGAAAEVAAPRADRSPIVAPLIPRALLFGDAPRSRPQLSPDGRALAYLADGRIYVESLGGGPRRAVSADMKVGIGWYQWAADGSRIVFVGDQDGDEQYHLYVASVESGETRDLTPHPGIKVQNVIVNRARPAEVFAAMNLRSPGRMDGYRLNLETGSVYLEVENPGDVLSWTSDSKFVIRAATAFDPASGATIVRVRDGDGQPWRDILRIPFERAVFAGQSGGGTIVAGFGPGDRTLYVVSRRGGDKAQIVELDCRTGHELRVVAASTLADVVTDRTVSLPTWDPHPLVLLNPVTHSFEAAAIEYETYAWEFADRGVRKAFATIGGAVRGFPNVVSRDHADDKWIVGEILSDGPLQYWLFDRKTAAMSKLFVESQDLSGFRLATQKAVRIRSRDGLTIVSYLTLPVDRPSGPLPLVVLPHGGPWWRDDWGYDPVVQLLANRGYAVLQPNYRGSIDFGSAFYNASTLEWGRKTQDDIEDATAWAVARGIADGHRLAIMGFSGGGFAALHGLISPRSPYACGVDVVGPTEIRTLFGSMNTWWSASKARWLRRVGDVEHDDRLNERISPLYRADRIHVPLLVAMGAGDSRVSLQHSDRLVAAARANGAPVTYLVYTAQGHDFTGGLDGVDFYGRVEGFLAECLGGRAEPPAGGPSSVTIR